MRIERDENGGFTFSEVEPQLSEFFLGIPAAADPAGDPAALERLYPKPGEAGEPGLNEEWAQFVVPELREAFASATAVVEGDLQALRDGGGGWVIPREHMDAWLNVLNQARLALAARCRVGEDDMDRPAPYSVEDERGLAIAQIHVYGLLQECLIRYME